MPEILRKGELRKERVNVFFPLCLMNNVNQKLQNMPGLFSTDSFLANAIQEQLVKLAIEDKFPMDLNNLDMDGVLKEARISLNSDVSYQRIIKGKNLAKYVSFESEESVFNMLEKLELHPDKTELCDWVDGVQLNQALEGSLTVETLLEMI